MGNAADAFAPSFFRRRAASNIPYNVLSHVSAVKRQEFTFVSGELSFVSMSAPSQRNTTTLAERIRIALDEEGLSQNAAERKAGFGTGHLSRYVNGKRGGSTIDVEKMQTLAGVLQVGFEWLVTGEGPMRRDGWGMTPFEEAKVFARRAGCRDDALDAAWDRNRDRADSMSVMDWIRAIDIEARLLNDAGVMRPEKAAAKQASVRRTKKKLDRVRERASAGETSHEKIPMGRPKRLSGGL